MTDQSPDPIVNPTEQSTAHLRAGVESVLAEAREKIEQGVDSEAAIRNALSSQLAVVPPDLRVRLLSSLAVGAIATIIHGPIRIEGGK